MNAYTFLPWLRQGLAIDARAAPAGSARAVVPVALTLRGTGIGADAVENIQRDIPLYGPGDIAGIDKRAIVRVEPRDNSTSFEPNYIACIEFYDEDYPWRYSPAVPDLVRSRLTPWLALVVLADGEFTEGENIKDKPLPFVSIANPRDVLPPADQLWAWAHVHVNRAMPGGASVTSDDRAANAAALQAVLDENADLACSRIVCPRKLKENSGYTALLVPVFESGRLAGLGLDPAGTPNATFSAWADYPAGAARPEPDHFPYYHRWYFRTGGVGDFEYLVRLLQPRPVDSRVGYRDVDVQAPGSNLPGIRDAALGGVLKLGGALRAPRSSLTPEERALADRYENWAAPEPHAFQGALASLVNLADDYAAQAAASANAASGLGASVQGDPDPLITPPVYGRWHGLSERLLFARDGRALARPNRWVHDLNLDPALRIAAGFGTAVVQGNQESYMDAAWGQVGAVLEANRRIRLGQVALQVSQSWYTGELVALQAARPERALTLMAPVQSRVMEGGVTVRHRIRTSTLPPAALSAPMRRMLRPRGRLMRALPFTGTVTADTLLARLNTGEVSAAPPKVAPSGAASTGELADAMAGAVPPPVAALLRAPTWVKILLLLLLLLLLGWLALAGAFVAVGVLVAAIGALLVKLAGWRRALDFSDTVRDPAPGSTAELPTSSDFRLSTPTEGFVPTRGGADSPAAQRFKAATEDWYRMRVAAAAAAVPPPRATLDLPALTGASVIKLDPAVTLPRRIRHGIDIPAHIQQELAEDFREVMAYPVLDIPMYEPLVARSTDMFLPNLNLLEENSITLLETNQRFLEAYMVGVNHEFARELLWREYPTDQRGTCFAQFWDTQSHLDTRGLPPEQLRASLRDIPPIHTWPRTSRLGAHDNRQGSGLPREEAVLAIRGELLKKYPTAVIYAQRAEWQRKPDGSIDNTRERVPVMLTASEEGAGPPPAKVRLPLYEAKVAPDIHFFGFDLSVTEARGGSGENAGDPAGWFFVIKERPGDPRFGFDIERSGPLNIWNDMSWDDARTGIAEGQFVEITAGMAPKVLDEPTAAAVAEKHPQWEEDQHVRWNGDTNSADLAYILYQAPVRVMVHAAEMLPRTS